MRQLTNTTRGLGRKAVADVLLVAVLGGTSVLLPFRTFGGGPPTQTSSRNEVLQITNVVLESASAVDAIATINVALAKLSQSSRRIEFSLDLSCPEIVDQTGDAVASALGQSMSVEFVRSLMKNYESRSFFFQRERQGLCLDACTWRVAAQVVSRLYGLELQFGERSATFRPVPKVLFIRAYELPDHLRPGEEGGDADRLMEALLLEYEPQRQLAHVDGRFLLALASEADHKRLAGAVSTLRGRETGR